MSKKKKVGLIAGLVVVVVLAGIAVAVVSHVHSTEGVTRFEWIKMLCGRENIEGYENTPFYSDVEETNEYYDYIQAAVERDIIPIADTFDGDEASTGRFVALTAMRSVGKGRIRLSQGIKGDIDDDDLIDIAVDNELIQKRKLGRPMSAEDCERLLDKLDELYYTAFLKDDYERIEYTDKVTEIAEDAIVDYASDYTTVTIESDHNDLTVGDIVVFDDKNTHARVARKVTEVNDNGDYRLSVPSIDEVVKKVEVSDIVNVTAEDIFSYYNGPEDASVVNTQCR